MKGGSFSPSLLNLNARYPQNSYVISSSSSEIAHSFAQAVHFNTFGGNPVASAVGKAVLEVLPQEVFQFATETVFAVPKRCVFEFLTANLLSMEDLLSLANV